MSEVGNFETFSTQERAYFESKGEKPVETETEPVEESDDTVDEGEDGEAPEVEAKEEAETEDSETEEKPKRKDQRVPLRKLQEEVNARRELERRNAELQEQFARADERLRMLFQAQQPEQKQAPIPDPKDDPIGFMEWQKGEVERLSNEQRQAQESYRQAAQINAIDAAYKQSWGAFVSERPDALDAYQHFVNTTAAFLEMQGVSPEQINNLVQNEERKITVAAMQRGVNPAELIYEKAKTFGYIPKADDVAKKAESDIDRRNKASVASKSLSSTGGTKASTPSALDLANMSEEEFEEFRTRNPRAYRKLMGD